MDLTLSGLNVSDGRLQMARGRLASVVRMALLMGVQFVQDGSEPPVPVLETLAFERLGERRVGGVSRDCHGLILVYGTTAEHRWSPAISLRQTSDAIRTAQS